MDGRLGGWARAVKHRHRHGHGLPGNLPPLWLMTDQARLPDLRRIVDRLPPRLAGVIFRDDGPGHDQRMRMAQALALAEQCRRRHIALSVAGSIDLPARYGAGRHLRRGRRSGRRAAFLTSSAHGVAELVRARRAGAALILLSPVFATVTHPDARALGVQRWAALTRRDRMRAAALGGVTGDTVGSLPRWCRHVAAIGGMIG